MKEVVIAMQIYFLAFVIAIAIAFLIRGMLSVTRFFTRKKEEITKESEV